MSLKAIKYYYCFASEEPTTSEQPEKELYEDDENIVVADSCRSHPNQDTTSKIQSNFLIRINLAHQNQCAILISYFCII